jgi:hypothetical protein
MGPMVRPGTRLGGTGTLCSWNKGLRCSDGACAPLGTEGTACGRALECTGGLGIGSICASKAAAGEACDLTDVIESSCVDGYFCDLGVCVPERLLAEQRIINSQCASDECIGGVCVPHGAHPICESPSG